LHKDVQEKKDIYAPFNTISSLSMPRVHPSPSCSWRRYVRFRTVECVSSKRTM